ncbi:hypothetical protein K488DRAFT_75164, partial [Vararia minispora EC-137]
MSVHPVLTDAFVKRRVAEAERETDLPMGPLLALPSTTPRIHSIRQVEEVLGSGRSLHFLNATAAGVTTYLIARREQQPYVPSYVRSAGLLLSVGRSNMPRGFPLFVTSSEGTSSEVDRCEYMGRYEAVGTRSPLTRSEYAALRPQAKETLVHEVQSALRTSCPLLASTRLRAST